MIHVYQLTRNDTVIHTALTDYGCADYIHQYHSYSFDHALKYEGYVLEETMLQKVCDLPGEHDWRLYADSHGNPYVAGKFDYAPDGIVFSDLHHVVPGRVPPYHYRAIEEQRGDWIAKLNDWLRDPGHDALRARGDARWQAASCAESRLRFMVMSPCQPAANTAHHPEPGTP